MNGDGQDYSVGYGRPPVATRFKKGASGNPKGRPRLSPSLDSFIEKELRRPVSVVENGVRKTISKREAIAKRIVNGATTGDKDQLKALQATNLRLEQLALRQQGPMFLLSVGSGRFHALIKYDHQTVLSYEIENRENAHYAMLQQLQDTFVQSPEALQKSAIIGLTDAGGALCVRDRGKSKGITHYFRAFLGAQRRYTEGGLTNQLAEVTQAVAKQYL